MSDSRHNNPNMPFEPPQPNPIARSKKRPKRHRLLERIQQWMGRVKIDTGIALSILALTGVLVWLTWIMVFDEHSIVSSSPVQTRIIDPAVPAKDVRVIVRPPAGKPAKDYRIKPVGQAVRKTDEYGECSIEGAFRGCSADLFDTTGAFLATIILPTTGHLEVRIVRVDSASS